MTVTTLNTAPVAIAALAGVILIVIVAGVLFIKIIQSDDVKDNDDSRTDR
jgi:hypothetical protein